MNSYSKKESTSPILRTGASRKSNPCWLDPNKGNMYDSMSSDPNPKVQKIQSKTINLESNCTFTAASRFPNLQWTIERGGAFSTPGYNEGEGKEQPNIEESSVVKGTCTRLRGTYLKKVWEMRTKIQKFVPV